MESQSFESPKSSLLYAHQCGVNACTIELLLELLRITSFSERTHTHTEHWATVLLTLADTCFPAKHGQFGTLGIRIGLCAKCTGLHKVAKTISCCRGCTGGFGFCGSLRFGSFDLRLRQIPQRIC